MRNLFPFSRFPFDFFAAFTLAVLGKEQQVYRGALRAAHSDERMDGKFQICRFSSSRAVERFLIKFFSFFQDFPLDA
jgi:hypothetical protein